MCLLPLGGFVKMTGETSDQLQTGSTTADLPMTIPARSWPIPVGSGCLLAWPAPLFNFILAFVLMMVYFAFINEVPDIRTTKIEWVTPGSAADHAGLQARRIISAIRQAAQIPTIRNFTTWWGRLRTRPFP